MTDYYSKSKKEIIDENKTLRGMLAKAAHGPAVERLSVDNERLERENKRITSDLVRERQRTAEMREELEQLRAQVEGAPIPFTVSGIGCEYENA